MLVDGYAVHEHPNYWTWATMKSRCRNPGHPSFKNYGGRGITYDPEWESFDNFCRDMGVRPSPDHTIDRIDNDKGYFKANCRWATRTEQCLNRRTFRNNTTGVTGVVVTRNGRYKARYDEGGRRWSVAGTFETADLAWAARKLLISALRSGKDVSGMIDRKARFDSATGVKGVTQHKDGGFVVRATDTEGVRHYLGYVKTVDEAKERIAKWQAEQN